tara:strand:+ start:148 stop:675 length:528 start_codon:yes stop_codon:yes gene_type:complete
MNLPNILSISRIVLLIPIIIFFENDLFLFSLTTFIFASVTDFLDGYFARKVGLASNLGAFLDLLADKIFVSIILIWMTYNFDNLVILISSILIVSREISISYLRLFISSQSKNSTDVKPDLLGKYKTAFQMIAIGFLLISPITSDLIFNISLIFLFLSALISWYSLFQYLNKWIV